MPELTPTQLGAAVVFIGSLAAFLWPQIRKYLMDANGPQIEPQIETVEELVPDPRIDTSSREQLVEAILNACPYADDAQQLEYLASTLKPHEVIEAEMHRLGKIVRGDEDEDGEEEHDA